VQLGGLFASLEDEDDPYEIELDRAIELIKQKREAEAKKTIRRFSDDVQILNGRWGPYIKYHGKNVKIPKDVNAESLTLEDCERLFEESKNKPKRGGGRRKTAKKKS
jgi:DNA topoisomerase-1